jgi:hypothetical protein
MSSSQSRQPAGVPTGGQFAGSTHAEADVSIDDVPAEPVRAGDLIDYLSQFGDGDEVTPGDIDAFFAERAGNQPAADADSAFEAAVDQLREAQSAVLGASTVVVATAVRNAASNAAEIVVVADDEYPNVVYLSEVRDAAGETIGERFDDDWVSKLDDELREHMGNASVYGDYDLTGGEQLTLDVRNLIWSS